MDYTTLEGFDEKYAKVRIREHKKFGGKVIEVLYGAKDAEGNPIQPQEGSNDGHGRWFGIEVNGEKRMFSLQKPNETEVLYTTDSKENALEDMENTIDLKQNLCREATDLLNNEKGDIQEAFNDIVGRWNACTNWNTPKEEDFQRRFTEIQEEFAHRNDRIEENLKEKEEILVRARSVAESTNWKKGQDELNKLRQDLQHVGFAGVAGKELDKEFKNLYNSFQANRKKYYSELDQNRSISKEKKEALIEKAKEVAAQQNFKSASDQMVALMEEWKKAGSAGHATDEELWETFNGIRNEFYDKRKTYFAERKVAFDQSISTKKALIEEAKKISEEKDYSKEKTERMKALDQEWRKAGYSGKEDNDKLWDTFTQAKEVFWQAKHQESQQRFVQIIDRKKENIKKLREEIEELGIKEYETDVYDEIRGIQRRIEEKKEVVNKLEEDVKELQAKIEQDNA